MITAVIIDDDKFSTELLKDVIQNNFNSIKLVGTTDSQEEGERLIREKKPDIVFLDIVMPNEDGFQFLERFETYDFFLVFVTSHAHYSLQAFKTNAVDFLMKPVRAEDLNATLSKIIKEQKNLIEGNRTWDNVINKNYMTSIGRLVVSLANGVKFIKTSEIVRLEADSNYCFIYTNDGKKVHSSKTLKYYNEQLVDNPKFFRIHKSHLINIEYLSEIVREDSTYFAVIENLKIVLAKSKYAELTDLMSR